MDTEESKKETKHIEKILFKNKFIESFTFIALIILLVILSLVFFLDNFMAQITVICIFFFGLVLIFVLGSEVSSLKFSEVLSYYLDMLSNNINRHDTKEQDVADEGKKVIRTADRLIDDYIAEGRSKHFLVFGFDNTERILRKLQKNLSKAYGFFNSYEDNKKHRGSLEKNFRRISSILKQEKEFLQKEESILDELERLPILEQELAPQRLTFLRIIIKRYAPYRVLVFSAGVLLFIWVLLPLYFPRTLTLENKILVTVSLIGTAIIEDVRLLMRRQD